MSKKDEKEYYYEKGRSDALWGSDPVNPSDNFRFFEETTDAEADGAYHAGQSSVPKEDRPSDWSFSDDTSSSDDSSDDGCFLTTACVEHAGLPDDCVELQSMRAFRDGYIASQPEGPGLIQEYYRDAPHVVQRIHSSPDCDQTLEDILLTVRGIVTTIASGRQEKALSDLKTMFTVLREKYM